MDSSSQQHSSSAEYDCNALGGLFQIIINDLRNGIANWDDLLLKANKFHMQLKATIIASTAFLDTFQKIADMATTTRSGTKEIGSALTRLCLRQRSVEAKLKSMNGALHDSFMLPLQDRVDEWKRVIVQLDKDHSKEVKRLKQFRKKHHSSTAGLSEAKNFATFASTIRLKKGAGGGGGGRQSDRLKSIGSMYDMSKLLETLDSTSNISGGSNTTLNTNNNIGAKEKFYMLEDVERNFVRRVLTEERSHYCLLFNFMRPMLEEEISMVQEVTHLEEVVNTLNDLTIDPFKLPLTSEAMLSKLQLSNAISAVSLVDQSYQGVDVDREAHYGRSRKSSISSINSINSLATDSISLQNCKSLSQPNILPEFRPKSIASQDSGFLSTNDYNVPSFNRFKAGGMRPFVGKSMSICPTMPRNGGGGGGGGAINNRKAIVSMVAGDCLDGEYASTDELFYRHHQQQQQQQQHLSNVNNSNEFPVYMNLNVNMSDGSVTPTNHESAEQIYQMSNTQRGQQQQQQQQPYRLRSPSMPPPSTIRTMKPNPPPKPPLRISSSLSTSNSNNKIHPMPSTLPKPLSTRIYVVQPDNANFHDFPPPPPEAYVDYATPSNVRPGSNVNASSGAVTDCNYASPQLILCTDINCLKGQHQSAHPHQQQSFGYETIPCINGNGMHMPPMLPPEEEMRAGQHRRFKSIPNLAN